MIEFAQKSRVLSYDEALLYCKFLDFNGYTDWRMPTFEECIEHAVYGWCVGRITDYWHKPVWTVTPVRDINKIS
jgi:hypothetical protein